jgi:hypothetical protein
MAEEEKMTRISATIPERVADQFKEFCKRQRRSVSAQITLLMEQAMKENHPPSATPGGRPIEEFHSPSATPVNEPRKK